MLAAIAPYTERALEVRDARELRVKESDRIAALATNLRRMGADVEEREDGLRIPGGQTLHGAEIDAFGDHRIAMALRSRPCARKAKRLSVARKRLPFPIRIFPHAGRTLGTLNSSC